ncbi:helix-turn-helix domain-containing protein [Anaerosoma tenue]|uniref:helix-turn-helix domain-containing protein n=1 Tax=Anaerosoma tenue TaxID=2933588 RepID=UPI0022609A78|nr:helix-turn-helix domain-containing protein [Anaerosoma tenue]MCK8113965.1 helix-turn-helix domain-containing protein [Anaerosoma tenue]
MDSRLLSVDEAQKALGVHRSTLYELMRSGDIESVRIGRRRLIPVQTIEAFIEGLRAVAR